MKRLLVLFSTLMIASMAFSQSEILAQWTFPTGNLTDTLPDGANQQNLTRSLATYGGTSAIQMKNGATSKAAQASGWENGQGNKYWQIGINTLGYNKIEVSSKQTAGGAEPGPKDFKLQYRIGSTGVWTDVDGAQIVVANDWTTGVLDRFPLPVECSNQPSVFLRWIMTTNLDSNGAEVLTSGKAKIDDIIISADQISGIEIPALEENLVVYPNPCRDRLMVKSTRAIDGIEIFDFCGVKVFESGTYDPSIGILTDGLVPGFYLVKILFEGNGGSALKRVIIF